MLIILLVSFSSIMTPLSSRPHSFHLLSCLLLNILVSQATAANTPQNFHYFCDDTNDRGNYTANSIYARNLNTLLSTITYNREIISYGFYASSYGQEPNTVNAIGLCRGDQKPYECRSCLNQARANLTQICPNRKEAIGWYEDEKCMLRYSDRLIFGKMETGRPAYYANNLNNATDLDEFNEALRNLLNGLRRKASSGGPHFKYAVGDVGLSNFKTVYGLVQCTPDVSAADCDNCLAFSISRIPIDCCKDKIGGRVVRPSCNMRFETLFRFYGDTAYASSTNNSTSSQGI